MEATDERGTFSINNGIYKSKPGWTSGRGFPNETLLSSPLWREGWGGGAAFLFVWRCCRTVIRQFFFTFRCSVSHLKWTCFKGFRRILGGRNLVRVRNIVVAAIFDFMTVDLLLSSGSFNMALSRANCALKENACTACYKGFDHCLDSKRSKPQERMSKLIPIQSQWVRKRRNRS